MTSRVVLYDIWMYCLIYICFRVEYVYLESANDIRYLVNVPDIFSITISAIEFFRMIYPLCSIFKTWVPSQVLDIKD